MLKKLIILVLSVFFSSFCITASIALAQKQNGPGGQDIGIPLTTFETDDFSGSGVCAHCHSKLYTATGEDVSIDAHWRSTMMANAAKDPLWLAKVKSEVVRNPALKDIIEEKCARCHMGMARYQAETNGSDIGIFDEGFLNPDHPLHQAAMDGVSCALCHQIQEENLGEESSFTGKYIIDTASFPPHRKIFGPYENPAVKQTLMENNSGFSPLYSGHFKESKLCSSCHTLFTPTVDSHGNVIPDKEFPEQMTYLEWKHSNFNTSCQGCHVPEDSVTTVISNRPKNLEKRTPFGLHHFVGGNSFMLELLKNNSADLGVTADTTHLNNTIARTITLLGQKTATISSFASLAQNQLTLEITLKNLAGHKVPTGIPIRRLWLHVTVVNANNDVIFESGKPLPDGRIVGNDADEDATMYEPHYDFITNSSQVQIYEAIMRNTDNEVTQTLLRAYSYAKDNRLLPAGFIKETADDDVAVWGNAKTDEDFTGGQDDITYQIDVDNSEGPFVITTELLFQALSYPFIKDFQADDVKDEELVVSFMGQYANEDKVPVLVAMEEISVP